MELSAVVVWSSFIGVLGSSVCVAMSSSPFAAHLEILDMRNLGEQTSKVRQHHFKAGWRNISLLLFLFEGFPCVTEMDGLFPWNSLCKDGYLLDTDIKRCVRVKGIDQVRLSAKCRLRGLDQWRAVYRVQLSHLDSSQLTGVKPASIPRAERCSRLQYLRPGSFCGVFPATKELPVVLLPSSVPVL